MSKQSTRKKHLHTQPVSKTHNFKPPKKPNTMNTRTHTWEQRMTTQPRTCPITGEPLYDNHTVSTTAIRRFQTAISNLPDLIRDAEYALTGLRNGQTGTPNSHTGSTPINLTLLEDLDDMKDALNTWAFALVQHTAPYTRFRNGDWHHIRATLHTHIEKAQTWTEAPTLIEETLYITRRLEHLASPKPIATSYRGKCPNCNTDVTARNPEQTTRQCTNCGQTINLDETHTTMLNQLATTPMTRTQAVRAAEYLTGTTINLNTVKTLIRRKQLTPNQDGKYTPQQIIENTCKNRCTPIY